MIGADEVCLGYPEPIHEPLHHHDVVRQAVVVRQSHLRVAEAEQVGCDDPVLAGEHGDHVPPLVSVERAAVQQEDGRATSFVDVGDVPGAHSDVALALRELLHRRFVRLRDERSVGRGRGSAVTGSGPNQRDQGEQDDEAEEGSKLLHDRAPS